MSYSYLAIFMGGGLGSVSRFVISSLISKNTAESFPLGTLAVNLIGAFLIGALIEFLALRYSAAENLRYFLVTGFLGGFTTFSAFSLESASMWMKAEYWSLVVYVLASVVGTIVAVIAAIHLVRNCL